MNQSIYKANTAFKTDDAHYVIQAVIQGENDTELFCKLFDIEKDRPAKSDHAQIFRARELSEKIVNGDAIIIDPSNPNAVNDRSVIHLTQTQINNRDMWFDFCERHNERNKGKNLTTERNIEESIKLFPWLEYNHNIPGISTCQGYIKRYSDRKDPRSLINWGGRSDKGEGRFAEEIELIILQHICDHYLIRKDKKALSRNAIAENTRKELKRLNAQDPVKYPSVPSKQSILTRMDRVHPLTKIEKQLNKSEQRKLKRKLTRQLFSDCPMQRVEIDAIDIAIGLKDEDGESFLGSVVLMMAIDVFTRCIVGFSIVVGEGVAESADLAVECVKDMVRPKENRKGAPYGRPTYLVHDSTSAMKGDLFKRLALAFGIAPINARTGDAWAKPFIERFFLTLRIEFLANLPGYLGSKRFKDHRHLNPNDTLKNHATLTLSEFIRRLEDYIDNYYHTNAHNGLNNRSPINVWNKHVSDNEFLITTPEATNEGFDYMGLEFKDRTIYELGYVKVKNEIYRSDDLKTCWLHGLKKATVFYSHIDASKVIVKIDDEIVQNEIGRKLIVAERRETSYQPTHDMRASIDIARNSEHGDIEESERTQYALGSGIQNIKKTSSGTTINNDNCIDTTANDAQEQLDSATDSWSNNGSSAPLPSDESKNEIELILGEEL